MIAEGGTNAREHARAASMLRSNTLCVDTRRLPTLAGRASSRMEDAHEDTQDAGGIVGKLCYLHLGVYCVVSMKRPA